MSSFSSSSLKLPTVAAMFIVGMGSLADWSPAHAQSRKGGAMMIVNQSDDGSGGPPQIMHFSMPDIFNLRKPDFVKKDAPIFKDKLVMSDAQQAGLERQIEAYLAEFSALKKEKFQNDTDGPMFLTFGGNDEDGDGGMGMMIGGSDNGDDIEADAMMDFDGQMPPGSSMEIAVTAGGPGPGQGDDGGAAAGGDGGAPVVAIQLATRDGVELTDEQRKKLEERAKEMGEKIKAKIEQRMAEQEAAGEQPGGHAEMPFGNIEQIEQQQKDLAARAAEFAKAKAALRAKFVTEAQASLAPPQVERWPALERALLREKSLPEGRIPGEKTDLLKVVKSAGVDEQHSNAIAAQLDSYDLALDNALRQRNEYVSDANDKMDKALQEQNFDRALSIVDHGAALRVAVRSVNEQFTESIANLLPSSGAETFRAAVLKASYPMVYRKTFGQKTFDAASKIEGIDPATRASIADLQKAYASELEQVNQQLRKVIDQNDPKQTRRPIEHMKQVAAGAPPAEAMDLLDDPEAVTKAFTRRRELDQRYAKAVADQLAPEQREQLPKLSTPKMVHPMIIRRSVGDGAK